MITTNAADYTAVDNHIIVINSTLLMVMIIMSGEGR